LVVEIERQQMILADGRWIGPHGIGRFAQEVLSRLGAIELLPGTLPLLHPVEPCWLSWMLFRKRPKAYFTPGFNPPLYSPVPFVFTIHDLNHLHFLENSNAMKRCFYHMHMRPACRRAFRVLTVSEFSRRAIIEWANLGDEGKVINVGNGISAVFSPEGKVHDPGYPYLVYVGNRKSHKNVRRLIEAYAASGVCSDVKLLLSGNPDGETERLTRLFALNGHVSYAGNIAEDRIGEYFRGATALVFPSLYEGFGLPVAEAMACGTPVITSNVTALPETAGDAALLVDPTDTAAIADAIRAMVSDSALRNKLRERGLMRAARYSWEGTAGKVRDVLQQAVSLSV
jgi:glycosyltransferase involved in cell wall biosynthesis